MSSEKTQSTDTVSCELIANTAPAEKLVTMGYFTTECFDRDGNLKWKDEGPNLVVNTGLQYMAGVALNQAANLVTQISTWYIGLEDGPGFSITGTATMASLGFTEFTGYSQGTRVQCQFVAATSANPSVASNSVTAASFSITSSGTLGGAFLTSGSAKSGTTGTLFSGKAFSGGDRTVANGDTLNVTYSLSLGSS
jgi:hypothetical protein